MAVTAGVKALTAATKALRACPAIRLDEAFTTPDTTSWVGTAR